MYVEPVVRNYFEMLVLTKEVSGFGRVGDLVQVSAPISSACDVAAATKAVRSRFPVGRIKLLAAGPDRAAVIAESLRYVRAKGYNCGSAFIDL